MSKVRIDHTTIEELRTFTWPVIFPVNVVDIFDFLSYNTPTSIHTIDKLCYILSEQYIRYKIIPHTTTYITFNQIRDEYILSLLEEVNNSILGLNSIYDTLTLLNLENDKTYTLEVLDDGKFTINFIKISLLGRLVHLVNRIIE